MTYMPVHPFVFTKCQIYMTVVLFKAMSSQYIAHQLIHSCCNHKTVGIERTNISCESIQLTDRRIHIEVTTTKKIVRSMSVHMVRCVSKYANKLELRNMK